MRLKKSKAFMLLIAITGFVVQVCQVSNKYFGYQTRTQIDIRIPEKAVFHNLSLCFTFVELIDNDRLERDLGMRIQRTGNYTADMNAESPTIRQIFNYTPAVDEILVSCGSRDRGLLIKWTHESAACYKMFTVSKYLSLDHMCYKFVLNTPHEILLTDVTQCPYWQFGLFGVQLKAEIIRGAGVFLNIIAFTGKYPHVSRNFSPAVPVTTSGENKTASQYFDVFSSDIMIKLRPRPYDTACIDRHEGSMHTCVYQCLLQKYASVKKIHTSIIIPDLLDHKILTQRDLEDNETMARVMRNKKDCEAGCKFIPCSQEYTRTSVTPGVAMLGVLEFNMRTPTDPDIISVSQPVMLFVEYFSFMCSCFGTWFGVSFLSFDAFIMMCRKKRDKKIKTRQVLTPGDMFKGRFTRK